MSSCVASCCMSCRTASTAYGITDCSRARHAKPTSPASASCSPLQCRSRNPSRPQSHLISFHHAPAAAGACASSRPSNAGCSPGRRLALPQQPERTRDPARLIPTRCRRLDASANDSSRASRRARAFRRRDPGRNPPNGPPKAWNFARERLAKPSRSPSNQAQRTSRPPTPAQPKHQIPIGSGLHTEGSFLGDFRTPNRIRNSSRERLVRYGMKRRG